MTKSTTELFCRGTDIASADLSLGMPMEAQDEDQ